MITSEPNYMRKAHRLTIPIFVIWNEKRYKVRDWSAIGVAVYDDGTLPKEKNAILDAVLELPLGESAIAFKVQLQVRNVKEDIVGFSIEKISEKSRRVLRQYATQMIEGDAAQLESLAGSLFLPSVQTPIKEPIALTEEEHNVLKKQFTKRLLLYAVFIVAFLSISLYVLMYNITILYNRPGIAAGNVAKVQALQKGVVGAVYAGRGDAVFPGMRLYDLNTSGIDKALAACDALRRSLLAKQHALAGEKTSARSEVMIAPQQSEALRAAAARAAQAAELYAKRLISFNQYDRAQAAYLSLRRQQADADNPGEWRADTMQLKVYEMTDALQRRMLETEARCTELETTRQQMHGVAMHRGTVYGIAAPVGTPVSPGDVILLLQRDTAPYVLTKVYAEEAVHLFAGQRCMVYSASTDRTYPGHIEAVGYDAAEATGTHAMDIVYNEIPVRIALDDTSVRLPPSSGLDVWILRPQNALRRFAANLLW